LAQTNEQGAHNYDNANGYPAICARDLRLLLAPRMSFYFLAFSPFACVAGPAQIALDALSSSRMISLFPLRLKRP
jgi:hypothetical protein